MVFAQIGPNNIVSNKSHENFDRNSKDHRASDHEDVHDVIIINSIVYSNCPLIAKKKTTAIDPAFQYLIN